MVEVPAGCTNNLNDCQITISGIYAYGIAVDGKGNVYIPDRSGSAPYNNADNTNTKVVEINKSQPPSLTFAATNQGSSSSDSPQTVSVQNVGNAALTLTAISFPLDFPEMGDENDCSIGASLVPGLVCPLTIDFTPTVGGPPPGTALSESVGLTDNALNVTGATQSISVAGDALSPEVNVPNLVGQTQAGATGLLTGVGSESGRCDISIKHRAHRRSRQPDSGGARHSAHWIVCQRCHLYRRGHTQSCGAGARDCGRILSLAPGWQWEPRLPNSATPCHRAA